MTRICDCSGLVFKGQTVKRGPIVVRFTSDEHGETISLSTEDIKGEPDIMLIVAFEEVADLIKETRKEHRRKKKDEDRASKQQ